MANYQLTMAHLYGNLLNTYGDNGNLLMFQYYAKQMGIELTTEIISIHQDFDPQKYDLVFIGGGQDYEQVIVSKDIQDKKEALTEYIENDGVILAVCGGYQLLGHYYIGANGEKINGIGALDHYTLSQDNNRFIGDIIIHNEEFNETYYGFENHNGRTFLGEGERPLGKVVQGQGNNGEDEGEGVIYKNVYGTYFHGPILSRNKALALRLLHTALKNKYGEEVELPELPAE
ncbi:type 1 glutamine amidotransferase [Enterococcus pallens]|uniref:Lipid II isoglutaminyl synthase (glutamine-hydrolyzing) subunit GatD n=1 Tax=Enterococcus pallens ATCC BAA-351 TaxID=1158607 RepID=R2SS07_9ENTE|nr:glutamine amidotransferase [Enterococcus pallens]EOH98050.1 CobB/CobQ-like glutamine amidotransferase [Enterococcus pallens ATCC BAA-351]EOU20531.1 CobB/CobQ-like glutamine amidotransferase [Enterococcus pallens ATCC BAA-351]